MGFLPPLVHTLFGDLSKKKKKKKFFLVMFFSSLLFCFLEFGRPST